MGCDTMLPPQRDSGKLERPLVMHPLPYEGEWDGRIAYLDRDGVINRGFEDYVNTVDEIEILPLAATSIGELRRSGFRVCVVTNQSPVGRGLWTRDNLASIHTEIRRLLLLEDKDAHLDLILHSPYAPWENSWARKPNPGMLEASRQIMDAAHSDPSLSDLTILYGPDWKDRPPEQDSVMVGDRDVDMRASDAFGVTGIRCNPDDGISGVIDSILG
tara:strand:- start:4572 stop:5219 length:648 start_codon:yes stop_codon:yes gene_type:complete